MDVVLSDRDRSAHELEHEGDGYFSAVIPARPGSRYAFRLDKSSQLYPDPAWRFQPCGPHQPSEVVDAAAFQRTDTDSRSLAGRDVEPSSRVRDRLPARAVAAADEWSRQAPDSVTERLLSRNRLSAAFSQRSIAAS